MRLPALLLCVTLATAPAAAQHSAGALTRADSLLLYEVLRAEDSRDATAAALAAGAAHADPRLRHIAQRAIARLADSTFAARTSLGQPDATRPLPTWSEPEWAGRYRALGGRDGACAPLVAAFDDRAVQVRQRAIALSGLRTSCAGDAQVAGRLRQLADEPAGNGLARTRGHPSWHLRAEALVALARVAPQALGERQREFARHPHPMLRRAAARAAAIVRDTVTLRRLTWDEDGNVQEAGLRGLASVVGLAAADDYRRLLGRDVPQVALAAAEALREAGDSTTRRVAAEELQRRISANHASHRDVRDALRAILGEPPERWTAGQPDLLPWDVVGLALGERRYLEVAIARLQGGGRFTVELRGDVAPIQAARVLAHARAGAYDGTTWHRVEPNFVIQGGSPHDNEYSGSGRFLVDELSTVAHPRGSVGMSTRGHSTGDLQWFVNLRDNARLTGAYTTFAMVVSGMDVVDDILEGDRMQAVREVSAPRPTRP